MCLMTDLGKGKDDLLNLSFISCRGLQIAGSGEVSGVARAKVGQIKR